MPPGYLKRCISQSLARKKNTERVAFLGGLVCTACNSAVVHNTETDLPSFDGAPANHVSMRDAELHEDVPMELPSNDVSVDHAVVRSSTTTCAEGFRTTGRPVVDVTRLSLLCGPGHGMSRWNQGWSTLVEPGQVFETTVELASTQCVRMFVTSSPKAAWLRALIRDERGSVLGEAQTSDSFVVVGADGAVCGRVTGRYRLIVEAGGAVELAVELWTLPPR